MKVVIAGGGIAGNVLLRQLHKRSDIDSIIAYERRSYADASPPGLNVLMNHNGLAIVEEVDPMLHEKFKNVGSEVRNWSARNMAGEILYHLEDVVDSGDAPVPALVARWDRIHEATRCDDFTEYNAQVAEVQEEIEGDSTSKLKVRLIRTLDNGETSEEWLTGIDLVVAADGRYSTLRKQLAPTKSYYGPPFVADFRVVAKGTDTSLLTEDEPVWRVYNKPNPALFDDETTLPAVKAAASAGCVRVGIMKLEEGTLGIFGNIAMPDSQLDDAIKSGHVLSKLFHDDAPDALGSLVIQTLKDHGDSAHWTRKQETDTCYEALDGRVLFVGDAAGAIYPSLGQGANLSLEDACVAAAVFPDVHKIAQLRHPRREFIKDMSRQHAQHVFDPNAWDTEIQNWKDPTTQWRRDLRRLWCGKQLALLAVTATKKNFEPFGQLIAESLDGDLYSPQTDAVLDLSRGTPRFYLMKLEGGRPLRVDRITRHSSVTQCLGALGTDEDFYLVVHEPSDEPGINGLKAFRIPPRHFVKLHEGTWHVGPMWTGPNLDRTFMNLELADTNVVDHTTTHFHDMMPGVEKLMIPILPC